MKKMHVIALFIVSMLAVVSVLHCAAVKPVLHTVVDKCVEVSKPGTDVSVICATADDILPYLDLIMAARKKSALDAGMD